MSNTERVTLTWNHGGTHVLIAGSFNNWKATPMLQNGVHTYQWTITLDLKTNSYYEYKFIVDGNWFYDVDLPFKKDSHGNTNNTLTLGTPTSPQTTNHGHPTKVQKNQDSTSPQTSNHGHPTKVQPQKIPESSLPTSVSKLQKLIETFFLDILHEMGLPTSFEIARLLQLSKMEGYDLCLPCYQISKYLKQKPEIAAEVIVEKAKKLDNPLFEKIDRGSGDKDKALINFSLHPQILGAAVTGEYILPTQQPSLGESIVIEFSSPNTNKPLHLGHVRNNCLGESVARLLKYQGYTVHKTNLINDRGIHICKSMLAYKRFGHNETPETAGIKGDHLVGNYYVKFETELEKEYNHWLTTDEAQEEFKKWSNSGSGKRILEKSHKERQKAEKEQNEEKRQTLLHAIPEDQKSFKTEYKQYYTNNFSPLGKECNQMLLDWEEKKPDVRNLWEIMNGWVFDGFKETYRLYGVTHDVWEKESDVYEFGKHLVLQSCENGLLEKLDNGCIVCDLIQIGVLKKDSGEEPKKVLLRANGTSVYLTQDLGTASNRLKTYHNPNQLIYVVASEQDRHFQILFKIMENLHPESKGRWYHLSYGMVNLPTGRMKSREGTVVDADDLAKGLVEMAFGITKEKWPDLSEVEVFFRAEKIAMAALKFYILCFGPPTTISFDPTKSLQFHGKAGPYLLYQYARTRSIFKKAGVDIDQFQFNPSCLTTLGTQEEKQLLCALYQFPRDIQFGCESHDPSKVCDSIYNIAQSVNAWYRMKDKHQVVNCEDPVLKQARLFLVLASGNAIKRGLLLLGIETLEQM